MCDQTEIVYDDGEVVWVKLGPTWWPGQVLDKDKAPPDALNSFRKPPIAIVKFFKEELYEFVKNYNQIYKYNCNRKHEFIKKGLDQYRAKHPHMELFPSYICEAETLTHGDPDIIHSDEFKPAQKLDYNAIFSTGVEKKPKIKLTTPTKLEDTPKITHPRILQKYLKGTSDYKVHILVQEDRKDDELFEERMQLEAEEETMVPPPTPTPPRTPATPGPLICHACPFECNRISVMVLHNKTHSAGYIPYTPPKRPKIRLTHSTPKIKLSPKSHLLKKSRGRPKKIVSSENSMTVATPKPIKSPVKSSTPSVKRKTKEKEVEKPKTDIEIKNSLLADWSESSNDSFDILSSVNLCEKPRPVASPEQESDLTKDVKCSLDIADDTSSNKPVEAKKADCFDFDDEDEELAIESIGRKLPRLSTKSDDSTKKMIDLNAELLESSKKEEEKMDVDFDSKLNDLLQETKLPDFPSLPSDLKFGEDKSPLKDDVKDNDKKESAKPQQKTIFKTKTFFRSRHSRSQDAIEKYVADNTSVDKPPTYMEESEQNENPSDVSPVLTPPSKGSQTKTPKFAPKIQLKKLKAALNEQIKPQSGKSNEDRWDEDSLNKLIDTTSSVESNIESRTINDLLGSLEEPSATTQRDLSPPFKAFVKVNEIKSPGGQADKESEVEIAPVFIQEVKTSDSQYESTVSQVHGVEKLNKENVEDDILKTSDIGRNKITLSPLLSEEQCIVTSPKSTSTVSEPIKIIMSPRKSRRLSRLSGETKVDSTSLVLEDSLLIKPELNKDFTKDTKIVTSPRKVIAIKDRKASLLDSTQNVTSNDVQISEAQHILNETVLNSENLINQGSAIVEVKGSDSSESLNVDSEKMPTESDLQIAETLINLPTSGVTPMEFSLSGEDSKMSETDKNISAAKSLVQMSEAIQHEQSLLVTTTDTVNTVLHKKCDQSPGTTAKRNLNKSLADQKKSIENSKLFKILDEPVKPKSPLKISPTKPSENILNFQLGSQSLTKPRVIIRKGAPPKDIKQPMLLPSSPAKLIEPKEDESLFDINSMPIVLSDEILTPESIQKMPIVVSDVQITPKIAIPPAAPGKMVISEPIITPSSTTNENVPSLVKKYGAEVKATTVMKSMSSTPNILSKSSKLKTVKHLLVVDKNSGEQKIIASESFEDSTPAPLPKVIKRSPAILSRAQKPGEKFIILPAAQPPKHSSLVPPLVKPTLISPAIAPAVPKPSPAKRTQKFIITPQAGSQLVLEEPPGLIEKPKTTTTKAKIIQNRINSEPTGNAVMIITNAQGVQSKIVLTPEHQKVLFSKKPGQLTLTAQPTPQVKSIMNVPPPRAKSIAVTSQSIITSRGQIMNPISGNALITSTGQLFPAQPTVTSSLGTSSKQKGSIISSTKIIPPGERVIITGKPNQTILTSKGEIIMSQMAPTTSQTRMSSTTGKFSTSTVTSTAIAMAATTQKSVIGKPKQTITRMSTPTIINSKILSGDLATLLQGKKPGTIMHLSAAQFEQLQKTGQIIHHAPVTQIIQAQKEKPSTTKVQNQKIIVQKQTPTIKQISSPVIEKKMLPLQSTVPRSIPNLLQQTIIATPSPSPPKKQKFRELLATNKPIPQESVKQDKKKKTIATYSGLTKQAVDHIKPAVVAEPAIDLGNLDDLIPATTIATRKGELHITDTSQVHDILPTTTPTRKRELLITDNTQVPPLSVPEPSLNTISAPIQETSLPSTSIQPAQDNLQTDPTQQSGGNLSDGQLLAVPGENFGGPPNSFYLCVEENGTLTPIDNQPLVLENNQLVPMVIPPVLPEFLNTEDQILVDQQTLLSLLGGGSDRLVTGENQQLLVQGDVRQLMAALTPQATPNQDILAAALADTDVFQPDSLVAEGLSVVEMDALGGDFQNLNPGVVIHTNVSETSTSLKQPIMSPVEIPSKKRLTEDMPNTDSLEDSLAVIGVTSPSVPTSLDLPITVTNPRIAPKTTNPLSLSCGPLYVPSTLVHSPITTSLETFSSSSLLADPKEANVTLTSPVCTTVSESSQNVVVTTVDNPVPLSVESNKKQIASSMPCIDDSSSDSFTSDNPQLLTEAIQTKTYSPMSMPLLTEDPPLPSEALQPEDTVTAAVQEVKSMPELVSCDEVTSCTETTLAVNNSMPLLDDIQEDVQSTQQVEIDKNDVMTIPNNAALPKEIFNETSDTNEDQEPLTIPEQPASSQETVLTSEEAISSEAIQEPTNQHLDETKVEENMSVVPAENVEISDGVVPEELLVDDALDKSVAQVQGEPADGIPIIVTTQEGEPGVIVDVDLDVAPPSVPSPPEGNSLPHTEGEEHFSDASSDASTEIPLQPPIAVSQHSLSLGRNGDHDKRATSPNSLDSSPKRFKYDDER